MYVKGLLEEAPDGDMLGSFWESAPPSLKREIFSTIAEPILNFKDIPAEAMDRIMSLLNFRIKSLEGESTDECIELEPVGLWFTSSKFDPVSFIDYLITATNLTGGKLLGRKEVLTLMAEISHEVPEKVIDCLIPMFNRDLAWELSYASAEARSVLENVLISGNETAIEKAEHLRDKTLADGIKTFEGLLRPS